MKEPSNRTKVVLRHLPPVFSESALMEHIDSRFAGRYAWVSFCAGKNSQKGHRYSRAYIDFKSAEDVVEFAEFFDGHVFVNEKGAQFKTVVEYAPSQRVPKSWSKKDGREGTISKDPEYLEFLDLLAKPVVNLPSAEIQLEKREAERAVAGKEAPIVTPLMDFVREKRAAKNGAQRLTSNGKINRKSIGASPGSSRSASTRRNSEKRGASTSMFPTNFVIVNQQYVLRDGAKSGKEKPTYILVPRREDQSLSGKSLPATATTGTEAIEDKNGSSGNTKVLLLKERERETSQVSRGVLQQSPGSTTIKSNQQRDATSGRIIRGMISNRETRLSQPSTSAQSAQQIQASNIVKDKRPPRSSMRSVTKEVSSASQATCISDCDSKGMLEDKANGINHHGQEKRTRNKDRPDRGVWAPRRSDGANDESWSSSSIATQVMSDPVEGMTIARHLPASGVNRLGDDIVDPAESSHVSSYPRALPRNFDAAVQNSRVGRSVYLPAVSDLSSSHMEVKVEMPNTRVGDIKTLGNGRNNFSSVENGSHRNGGRRGPSHMKDVDGSVNMIDMKSSKKGKAYFLVQPLDNLTGYVVGSSTMLEYTGVFFQSSGSAYGFGSMGQAVSLLLKRQSNYYDTSEEYEANDMAPLGGEINPSLMELKHLKSLDLSGNNFDGKSIPEFLGSLKSLQYLSLSYAGFGGKLPNQLGNLSNLHYLSLRGVDMVEGVDNLEWLSHLSHLEYLDMSKVNLNNGFNSPLPGWLNRFKHLKHIDLSQNALNGTISAAIHNLTSITSLYLNGNNLEGQIPNFFGNLCRLVHLGLSNNNFNGDITVFLTSLSLCVPSSLEYLSLGGNKFLSGLLPRQLGNLINLKYLNLDRASFSGPIPLSLGGLKSLRLLSLSDNNFNASLPESLGNLSNLQELTISHNSLEGVIGETQFANLTRLQFLYLSTNSLALNVNSAWIPKFQLTRLDLSSCKLGPKFSAWLRTQNSLLSLDLSNASISENIPTWFWNFSSQLYLLDLSNNQIKGELPNVLPNQTYLGSNNFQGLLPRLTSNVQVLDLSNNYFSGNISLFLCHPLDETYLLLSLDLSRNLLVGEIPNCRTHLTSLILLNLDSNNLYGNIPSSMGSLSELLLFYLRNNSISGEVTPSLQNCTLLQTMDLGDNGLSGRIPA
ncbi:hypothetical protein GIB67_029948 [Kingdonia uniflora]|uniref:UPF3 domain-containing protein n=1 Tax=Kingdonia uniflora TaxID=39325 RepID=A0A7J7MY31_9MAGN|nr:hypothetical protein GIB67_029948 [Kingdonia uniflora]